MSLFFESDPDCKNAPPQIVKIAEALTERGFSKSVNDDLSLINLELPSPLVEKGGKILYEGIVVGYPRGIDPRKYGPVTMQMIVNAGTKRPGFLSFVHPTGRFSNDFVV
jgi:hypothetical protein